MGPGGPLLSFYMYFVYTHHYLITLSKWHIHSIKAHPHDQTLFIRYSLLSSKIHINSRSAVCNVLNCPNHKYRPPKDSDTVVTWAVCSMRIMVPHQKGSQEDSSSIIVAICVKKKVEKGFHLSLSIHSLLALSKPYPNPVTPLTSRYSILKEFKVSLAPSEYTPGGSVRQRIATFQLEK